jgi:enoyl-CoA hydratase
MVRFDYQQLDVSVEDDVCTVMLQGSSNQNAITERMHTELSMVFRDVADTDARVILLTGEGEAFSAGGDLDWLLDCAEDPAKFRQVVREGERTVRDILSLRQPLIAKINGDATGFAATLALFADVSIADENARIGDPHVNAGLVAGDGGAVIWPMLIGINRAKELLLTGELLRAKRAVELGLINRAVATEELDAEVADLAGSLAGGSQIAIQYTKRAMNTWLEFGVDLVLRQSLALEAISQQHPDHEEGLDAFLEGRPPSFPSARTDRE